MIEAYINYFRTLAVKNKKIRHVIAAESDNHLVPGERRFTLFNMEQVAKAVKSSMWQGPALHLHLYDWRTPGASRDDIKREFSCGFLITQKAIANNISSETDAYDVCEQIVIEILSKLRQDSIDLVDDCNFPFRELLWDRLTVNAAGPLFDNRHGWWVELPFLMRAGEPIGKNLAINAFDL